PLSSVLKSHLSLDVDAMADALHHSEHLNSWCSLFKSDTVFGAKWNFFQQKLSGRNIFVNPPFEVIANGKNLILKIIQKISDDLLSQKPTRALLLLPLLDGKESQITETATKAKFLEICPIPENNSHLIYPQHSAKFQSQFTCQGGLP